MGRAPAQQYRDDNPFIPFSAQSEEDVNLMAGVLGAARSGSWLTVPVGNKKAQRVRVIILEENAGNMIHMPGEANCAIVIDERAAAKHSGRDVFFWCGTGNFDISQARPVSNPDDLRGLISRSASVLRAQREEDRLDFAADPMVNGGQPETYAAAGECQWITIGAKTDDKGKKRGGTPVCIKDGRIIKGAGNLEGRSLDNLKEPGKDLGPRQAKARDADRNKARWAKEARTRGIPPQGLHDLAGDILERSTEVANDRTKLLQDARRAASAMGGSLQGLAARAARGTLDPAGLRGFDDVAAQMAAKYPEVLGDDATQQLFDMLIEGNPEAMSQDQAYQEAFDYIMEAGPPEEVKPAAQPEFDVSESGYNTEDDAGNPIFKRQSVFERGQKDLGEISTVTRPDGNREVSNVNVWPEFKRQGLGTKFYKHAFEQAKADGVKLFISNDRTEEAKALHAEFQRQGFLQPDGEINFDKMAAVPFARQDFTFQYAGDLFGEPCPKSVTAKQTGCTPAEGDGRQNPQIETPEFKAWFGDSKVVDESGKPLRVFHGTTKTFDSFSQARGMGSGQAKAIGVPMHFFTDDVDLAAGYAADAGEKGQQIKPVWLSIKKPLVIEGKGKDWTEVASDIIDSLDTYRSEEEREFKELRHKIGEEFGDMMEADPEFELPEEIQSDFHRLHKRVESDILNNRKKYGEPLGVVGYDGIIIREVYDRPASEHPETESYSLINDVYVAFGSSQIKSASGNAGTFDPQSANITMARQDFTFQYAGDLFGEPCPPSVTAKQTGCTPASGTDLFGQKLSESGTQAKDAPKAKQDLTGFLSEAEKTTMAKQKADAKRRDKAPLFEHIESNQMFDFIEKQNEYTPEEKQQILKYIQSGYVTLNSGLRGVPPVYRLDAQQMERVEDLDAALAKTPLQSNTTTYRLVDSPDFITSNPKSLIGETFTDPGYTSTSTDPSYAESEWQPVLELRIPAGVNAASIPDIADDELTQKEQELLLERGLSFRVVSVDESGKTPRYVVDVFKPPSPAQQSLFQRQDFSFHYGTLSGQPCPPSVTALATDCTPAEGGQPQQQPMVGPSDAVEPMTDTTQKPGERQPQQPQRAAQGAEIPNDHLAAAGEMFGRQVTPEDVFSAMGLAGQNVNEVKTSTREDASAKYFEIMAKTDDVKTLRTFMRPKSGGPGFVENGYLENVSGKRGAGIKALNNQISALQGGPFEKIITSAAKAPPGPEIPQGLFGYSYWPQVGYNGSLPREYRSTGSWFLDWFSEKPKMPKEFGNPATMRELMDTPGGFEWWKANGDTVGLTFDVNDPEANRRLQAFMREKGHG